MQKKILPFVIPVMFVVIFFSSCRNTNGSESLNVSPIFSFYKKNSNNEEFIQSPSLKSIENTSSDSKIVRNSPNQTESNSICANYHKIKMPDSNDNLLKKIEILYPLFEYQKHAGGKEEFGVRPLFYFHNDEVKKTQDLDFIYPIGRYYSSPTETIFKVLPLLYYNETIHSDGRKDIDSFIFPFIFYGNEVYPTATHLVEPLFTKDKNNDSVLSYYEFGGTKTEFDLLDLNADEKISKEEAQTALSTERTLSYFAVIPFGGLLRDFLLKEWIEFYLFPLFVTSMERGYQTWYLPFPIIQWGHGAGRKSFSINPLFSIDIKKFLIEDENGNIIEGPKKEEKRTVLWPFINYQKVWTLKKRYSESKKKFEYEHKEFSENILVFPFFGSRKTPRVKQISFLIPFFNIETNSDTDFTAVDLPWPIFRYAEGIGHFELRVFPLFYYFKTMNQMGFEHTAYRFLWPLIWIDTRRSKTNEIQSVSIAGIFWNRRRIKLDSKTGEPENIEGETKLWPLFGHHSAADDSVQFEILSIFPFSKIPKWDNFWASFYRLFYYEHNKTENAVRWNLFGPIIRFESKPASTYFNFFPIFQLSKEYNKKGELTDESYNFLYGLLGGGKDKKGSYLRFLWFLKLYTSSNE